MKKLFVTPMAQITVMDTADCISTSADGNAPAFENQLNVWDESVGN